jgi:hypothetical protein
MNELLKFHTLESEIIKIFDVPRKMKAARSSF